MPIQSKEIREALQAKRAEAQKVWTEFEPFQKQVAEDNFDLSSTEGRDLFEKAHEKSKEYQGIVGECKTLEADWEKALELEGIAAPSKTTPFDEKDAKAKAMSLASKSPGTRFVESEAYKELVDSGALGSNNLKFEAKMNALTRDEHMAMIGSRLSTKTLLQSGDFFDDPRDPGAQFLRPQRLPGYLELLLPPLKLRNLITIGATDNNSVEWVRQLTRLSSAAEVVEASASSGSSGTKPESGMTFDLQHAVVTTIAHWIPATRNSLADMAQLRTIIDSQLLDGVARRLNGQILSGDGNPPNLTGILNQGVQSQTDTVLAIAGARKIERVLAAITKIRLAFLEPSAVLMHPNDFEAVRLSKDSFGQYYFGPPSQTGETTLWGLPVIEDVTCTEGEPVVGDWSQAILYVREDVSITATDSHSDFFVRNMIAVLAEGRYALAVPRPDGFCTVDFSTAES